MKSSPRFFLPVLFVFLWLSLSACQPGVPATLAADETPNVEPSATSLQAAEEQDEPDQTATVTPAPIEEEPPTPTTAVTATIEIIQTFDFEELAFFGILPFEYEPCQDAIFSVGSTQPAIILDDLFGAQLSGLSFLCLFYFPEEETIGVAITNPKGEEVTTIDSTTHRSIEGVSTGIIPLVLAFDLPTGVWNASANFGGSTVETSFTFDPGDIPKMTIVRENAFGIQDPSDPARTTVIYPGESIRVMGKNIPKIEDLKVALMGFNDEVWNAVDGKIAQVQEDGSFELSFTIAEDAQSGTYMVVAFVEPFTGLEFQPSVFSLFSVFKE